MILTNKGILGIINRSRKLPDSRSLELHLHIHSLIAMQYSRGVDAVTLVGTRIDTESSKDHHRRTFKIRTFLQNEVEIKFDFGTSHQLSMICMSTILHRFYNHHIIASLPISTWSYVFHIRRHPKTELSQHD